MIINNVLLAQLGGAVFASQRAVLNMSQFIRTSASFGGGAVKGGVVLATACTFLQSLSSLVSETRLAARSARLLSPSLDARLWRL